MENVPNNEKPNTIEISVTEPIDVRLSKIAELASQAYAGLTLT